MGFIHNNLDALVISFNSIWTGLIVHYIMGDGGENWGYIFLNGHNLGVHYCFQVFHKN